MGERPLFCIVASREQARLARPDVSNYSPKELADKERVTVTTVYRWVKNGLPVLRHGPKGDILVNYQDYINWMIDCARNPDTGGFSARVGVLVPEKTLNS